MEQQMEHKMTVVVCRKKLVLWETVALQVVMMGQCEHSHMYLLVGILVVYPYFYRVRYILSIHVLYDYN